jgi:hypothetical protein
MRTIQSYVRDVVENYIIPNETIWKTTWMGLAVMVFGILTSGRLKASYGRHFSKNSFFPTINGKVGWIFQEIISPITLVTLFQTYKHPGPPLSKGLILTALWIVHYWNRAVFSVITSSGMKSTRVDTVIMALVFNIVNAGWVGYDLASVNSEKFTFTTPTSIGLGLFVLGALINISSDQYLQSLRRRKGSGNHYVLPDWGLYEYILSPNYAGEMIEWTGYSIILGKQSGWAFVLWTVCNLAPRARTNLEWYREKFGNKVGNRKALIPGVY